MAAAARCYGQGKMCRALRHGKSNRVLSYGSRTGVRCNGCDSTVLSVGRICMVLNLLCAPIFFSADSSSQPPLYLCCNSATFFFVCTMFLFTSSPARTSANSGAGSGFPDQDVSNVSPEPMRVLHAQQQTALASL